MAAGQVLYDTAAVVVAGACCFAAGSAAQRVKLPQITGYLVAGILAGPYGSRLISAPLLSALQPVESACLAVIAMAAGAELHLGELQRTRRQVLCITAAVIAASWAAVAVATEAVASSLPFMALRPRAEQLVIASLAGTLACARSPASAIAVLRETEGQGPYCSLVMAVVVVKDVLVFVMFATNLEVASSVMHRASSGGLAHLAHPAVSLAMSATLGVAGGALAGALLGPPPRALRLTATVTARLRGVVLVLV
eukprot:CAMPEP_0206145118 /NCGR_PEP_ID=MMETSP1473-20131121/26399_1 /ASSEMBLY_ACC=CAM_ASM_001109 /TAXON_ID=1461547 /ORGANISM="Stichococcus sp, Strain RCC1054" /LENGTH=252 /DNA_ID=CAMNT_0053541199 /DNA_START=549 /DNA_END=1303 /DNA_ORIENTATION=+